VDKHSMTDVIGHTTCHTLVIHESAIPHYCG
jgi:hypothetical protein